MEVSRLFDDLYYIYYIIKFFKVSISNGAKLSKD